MKTITFYSYKGGSGRSLALITFASMLSKAGKNVCMIDFDFEAPGLHYKWLTGKKDGEDLVHYLCRCAEMLALHKDVKAMEVQETILSVGNCVLDIKKETSKKEGWIKLIPSGDIEDPKYWDNVNEKLPAIFSFASDEKTDTADQIHAANDRLRLFDEIKAAIQNKIKPDYLLVDSRSGFMERVGVCTRIWADDVVFFVVNNAESKVGSRRLLRALRASGRVPDLHNQKPMELFVAISRLPTRPNDRTYMEKYKEKIEEIKSFLTQPCPANPEASLKLDILYPLTHDPYVSLDETTTLHRVEEPDDTELSRDYLALFKNLVLPGERKRFCRSNPVTVKRATRIFQRNPATGVLRNPADKARNVAFRADTFSNVLIRMAMSLKNEEIRFGVDEKKATRKADSSLKEAGSSCGENFAEQLLIKWEDEERKLDTKGKLDDWCLFDSDVGFGIFSFSSTSEIPFAGDIRLKNSFLQDTSRQYEVNILAFIEGYVSGVIKILTNDNVKIIKVIKKVSSEGKVDLLFSLKGE
jgi:MinD-like ATPase involved in chromosome partitioning or flagellar assembly